jgi:hypothetical protein
MAYLTKGAKFFLLSASGSNLNFFNLLGPFVSQTVSQQLIILFVIMEWPSLQKEQFFLLSASGVNLNFF